MLLPASAAAVDKTSIGHLEWLRYDQGFALPPFVLRLACARDMPVCNALRTRCGVAVAVAVAVGCRRGVSAWPRG